MAFYDNTRGFFSATAWEGNYGTLGTPKPKPPEIPTVYSNIFPQQSVPALPLTYTGPAEITPQSAGGIPVPHMWGSLPQTELAELRRDAERWRYFREHMSECDLWAQLKNPGALDEYASKNVEWDRIQKKGQFRVE